VAFNDWSITHDCLSSSGPRQSRSFLVVKRKASKMFANRILSTCGDIVDVVLRPEPSFNDRHSELHRSDLLRMHNDNLGRLKSFKKIGK
ncbi:hypothetical protein FGIG_07155, partial [Fasciola gigantica]